MNSTASPSPAPPPVRPREIVGWCCFDFANSSFTTVIITVVFAPYFTEVIAAGRDDRNTLWAGTLAAAQLLTVLVGPWLGAIADRTGRKKHFLAASAIGCFVPTTLLALTGPGTLALALGLLLMANFCFSVGENFTASFLPELSTPENCGRISGYGWSFGYCGGLVSLGLALLVLPHGVRWTFAVTGLFFALASLPTFLLLRERAPRRPAPALGPLFADGWRETFHYLRELPRRKALFRFFLAFGVFMMGVSSVIAFAAIYATQRLGYEQRDLILLFIFLQLSAAGGAFLFGFFQDRVGSRVTLAISLVGWVLVALGAFLATTKGQFFFVANLAGLVIGSTQSASRALVALLTPVGTPGETFGYWGFFGKLAAMIGPFTFGLAADAFGMRTSILLTTVWFVAGLVLVLALPLPSQPRGRNHPEDPDGETRAGS